MTFEEQAIETLLLCRGNSEMALKDEWDRSDDGFESQIEICDKALQLADQELVEQVETRLRKDGIPPFDWPESQRL